MVSHSGEEHRMEKTIIDERTGWKYELVGDYYIPIGTRLEDADPDNECGTYVVNRTGTDVSDRSNQNQDDFVIGRFGRAHEAYLKQSKRHVYSQLVAEGKLGPYLARIDEQANDMLELLIGQMAAAEGVTEALKARDQMAWVGAMNNIRARAEEAVNADLIYA